MCGICGEIRFDGKPANKKLVSMMKESLRHRGPDDEGIFTETFKDDSTKHIRQNVHTLFMPTQKYILSLAKDVGFILLGKIDMVGAQYEYQYIYILQKPE